MQYFVKYCMLINICPYLYIFYYFVLLPSLGLGKTIQVIAFFALLRHRNTKGPFLVVAPLATIPNWMKEFKKWLPECPVLLYHGMKTEREHMRSYSMPRSKQELITFPIIITSFEIAMVDRIYLQYYNWKYLVVDEGNY
jgi:ATP-dependent DNA helicase